MSSESRPAPVYLGDRKLLVRASWGGWMVVPTYNVDVAIGVARDGVIEPWTTRLVQESIREGNTVVNVGANFGYYTVLGASIVGGKGRVISIEANPHIIPYLLNSCYWAGYVDRVAIYNRAAWRNSGETLSFRFAPAFIGGANAKDNLYDVDFSQTTITPTLEKALWDHTYASIATDEKGKIIYGRDKATEFLVTTASIDDICADVPEAHLIHMDIEGSEPFALQGAKRLIERSPNIRIIFEWYSVRYEQGTATIRAAFEEIWHWLAAQGFQVHELHPHLSEDGSISLSGQVDLDYMLYRAAGGDFIAVRSSQDPWVQKPHGPVIPARPEPMMQQMISRLRRRIIRSSTLRKLMGLPVQ